LLAWSVSVASAQRPLGTDVSHYQGPGINWSAVKAAGVSFAWAKATEGLTFTDANFAGNEANAKAAGVYIGAYHFARPSNHPNLTGANSAESEAAFFWSVVSNYVKPGNFYLVPMLDWEDSSATVAAGFNATIMSAWVNQWCNSVSNHARLNGVTGLRPVVYTGTWFSRPSGTYPGLTTAVTNWPSWIAAYPATPLALTDGPDDTFPWPNWNIWQYANTNWSGGDADVFRGDINGLKSLFLIGSLGTPYFITQPADRKADQGGSLTMKAPGGGNAPLHYQWRFNGVAIPNATNSNYQLANIQPEQAGSYTVVATNALGSITSSVAVLTVAPPFVPVFADDFDVNSSTSWTLNRSSTDSRATFAYNYAPYGIPAAPHSVGGSTKGVKFEANVSAGVAGALNISPIGQSFGGNFRLHYDLWINANGPFPAGGSGSTQHQTAGVGTAGNRVQWGAGTADGVWFAIDGEGQGTDSSPDIRTYVGTALQSETSGCYVGGKDLIIRRSQHPYYENVFPGGQTAPAAQSQSGGLDNGTIGFGWRDVVINKTGNIIEWFIDGLKIASVTNSITANNIFIGYWDSFNSLSSNTNLSFAIVDNLRVEVPATAPAILLQPSDLAVKVTSNATFAVVASGLPTPTYQWQFNGADLPAATNSILNIAAVSYPQAGNYSVTASNIAGTATSSIAWLSILPAAAADLQISSLQSDGSVGITLAGDPGATYFIETSTNLLNWTGLTNVTLSGPTIQFNFTPDTQVPKQFYRARSAP